MEAAHNKESLIFQGHRYQIFQDLSQQTLIKRKIMKPHLQILQHNGISYHWGFPFALRFTYKEIIYTCKSVDDLISTIHDFCLPMPENTTDGSKRRATSGSPTSQQDISTLQAHSSNHKRSRFASPPPATEDQMDCRLVT